MLRRPTASKSHQIVYQCWSVLLLKTSVTYLEALQEPRPKNHFCIFVFFIKSAFFRLLHLLKYFKRHSAVVVLQGGDVVVAEREFSPSVYLHRDEHPFPISKNCLLQSVTVCEKSNLEDFGLKLQPNLWIRHIVL